jgi:hypothetical protein
MVERPGLSREEIDALREDLERRQAEDPVEPIVERRSPPPTVFKIHEAAYAEPPPLMSDDVVDTVAGILCDQRLETRALIDAAIAPLRERCAMLEGQLSALTLLLGADGGKSKRKAPR